MSEESIFTVKPREGETPQEAFYRWMHENNYKMMLPKESDGSTALAIVDGDDETIAYIG